MTIESKRLLYKSFSRFLKQEIECGSHSADTVESLEVAKQCLESAFNFNTDEEHSVPNLLSIFDANLKNSPSQFRQEPTAEAMAMAETLKTQGNDCMKENKFEEAVQCYTKSIELSPYNTVYYSNRAAAYSRMEKHHKAIKDCEQALEIDPNYSKAYGRMGIAYSGLSNHVKAVEAYKKALEFDPTNENCKQNIALAEERLRESATNGGSAAGGLGGLGGLDMGAFLNNPMVRNMAAQLATDPNTQNVLSSLFQNSFSSAAAAATTGGTTTSNPTQSAGSDPSPTSAGESDSTIPGGPPTGPGMEPFLRMGQQIAEQLRSQNPDLVNQLRQSFNNMPDEGNNPNA